MAEDKTFSVEDFASQGVGFTPTPKVQLSQQILAPHRKRQAVASNFSSPGRSYLDMTFEPTEEGNAWWQNEFDAANQNWLESWGVGLTKFVGKTGLYTIGNIGGLAVALLKTPGAIANGDFTRLFNNEFSTAMMNAEEWLDENLKSYYSQAEQDANFWKSMGQANFWANDVLGGMAFTVSAVLSAYLTGGGGLASAAARGSMLSRMLKGASVVTKGISKTPWKQGLTQASKLLGKSFGQTAKQAAMGTKNFMVGAWYEAGVEANHFIKDTEDKYKNKFIEEYTKTNGQTPSSQEVVDYLATKKSTINRAANALFVGNLALVGGVNMITLPSIFGRGLFKASNPYAHLAKGANKPVDWFKRVAGDLGAKKISKDAATGAWKMAFDRWGSTTGGKLLRGTYYTSKLLRNPLYEGFVEEGGQGLMSRAAFNYVAGQYNPEGTHNQYTMMNSLGDAFDDTYGTFGTDENPEFWKEVGIGVIIGALGAPTFRGANPFKDGNWQGGAYGKYRETRRDLAAAREMIDEINAGNVAPAFKKAVKASNSIYTSSQRKQEGIADTDFFTAKRAESAELFGAVKMHHDLGITEYLEEDFAKEVEEMPLDAFRESFGYENMKDEELEARKKEVVDAFRRKVEMTTNAINKAQEIIRNRKLVGEDENGNIDEMLNEDLTTALAYNIHLGYDLDATEKKLFETLSEMTGMDPRTLRQARNANLRIPFNKSQISKVQKELKKYQRYLDMSKKEEKIGKWSSRKETAEDVIANLEDRIKAIIREEEETRKAVKLEYNGDIDALYEDLMASFEARKQFEEVYEELPYDKDAITNTFNDLHKIAEQRRLAVQEFDALSSREGAVLFGEDVATVRADMERITKETLIKRWRQDLIQIGLKTGNQNLVESVQADETSEQLGEFKRMPDTDDAEFNGFKNEFSDLVEDVREKLKNPDGYSPETLTNAISTLTKYKEAAEAMAEEAANPEVKGLYTELQEQIDEELDILKELNKANKRYETHGTEPILDKATSLIRITLPQDEEERAQALEVLDKADADSLKAFLSIRKVEYDKGGTPVKPKNKRGVEITDTPITIMRGNPKVAGEGYALFYGDVKIGGITHPDKFHYEGRPLNPEVANELLALGLPVGEHELFKQFHAATTALFQEVDNKGSVGGKKIAETLYLRKGAPGFQMISNQDIRPLVGDLFTQNPEYLVEMGGKKGLFIVRDQEMFLVEPTGEVTQLESEEAINFRAKGIKDSFKSPASFANLRHQYVLVAPVGDRNQILGLDYPQANSYTEEQFKAELEDKVFAFDKVSNEDLVKEAKDKKIVSREIEMFVTLGNSERATSKVSVFVTIARRRTTEDPNKFTRAFVNIRFKPTEPGSWGVNWNVIKRNEDNDGLLVTYYQDNKKVEEPLTKDSLIRALNRRMLSFHNKKKKEEHEEYLDTLLSDSDGNLAARVADVKTRVETDTLRDLELAATPRAASGTDYYMYPRKAVFEKAVKVAKKEDAPVVSPTTSNPINTASPELRVVDNPEVKGGKEIFIRAGFDAQKGEESWLSVSSWQQELDGALAAGIVKDIDAARVHPRLGQYYAQFGLSISDTGKIYLPEVKTEEKPAVADDEASTEVASPDEVETPKTDAERLKEMEEAAQEDTNAEEQEEEDDDNPYFSRTSYDNTSKLTYAEALKLLKSILPIQSDENPNGLISLKEIAGLENRLKANGTTFGAFRDNIIYLEKNKANRGIVFHEAFHAVFRSLLSPSERAAIYAEAMEEFGVPSKEDLDKLRDTHPSYLNMSGVEVANLWYEEKLADKFANYAAPKKAATTAIGRFFQRIWNWITSFRGTSRAPFQQLFDNILSGQYVKPSSIYNNDSSVAMIMLPRKKRINENVKNPRLNRIQSERIISRVAHDVYDKVAESGTLIGISEVINAAMDNIADFYSVANWETERLQKLKNTNVELTQRFTNDLADMSSALKHKESRKIIRREVANLISMIDTELELYDEVEDADNPERSFDKYIGQDGGFSSLTKEMKAFLLLSTVQSDEFGVGLSEDALADPKYTVPVNVFNTYYNIQKGLVGASAANMLPRLKELAVYDKELQSVYDRMMIRIKADLNEQDTANDDLTFSRIKRSNFFNLFNSNFNNTRLSIDDTLFDVGTKKYKVVAANQRNAAETQVNAWAQRYERILTYKNPFDIAETITSLKPKYILEDNAESRDLLFSEEKLQARLSYIKSELFNELGMDLHINYIKWSFLNDNLALLNNARLEFEEEEGFHPNEAKAQELLDFHALFAESGVNSLNEKIQSAADKKAKKAGKGLLFDLLPTTNILRHVRANNRNPYGLTDFEISQNTQGKIVRSGGEGAVTRMKFIAASNAIFDTSVRPTSHQNAEGKTITDVTKYSFYSRMLDIMKSKPFVEYLNNINSDDVTWETLRTLLRENFNISYPDHFIRTWHNSLKSNPLVTRNIIEDIFNSTTVIKTLGGMREVSIREDDSINTNKDYRDGKTWKHLDIRSKIINSLINFVDEKSGTDNPMYYSMFTINSDKSTVYSKLLPKKSYVTSKGLTAEARETLFELFETDYNRVSAEYQNIEKVKAGEIDRLEGYNHDAATGSFETYLDKDGQEQPLRAFEFNTFIWLKDTNPGLYNTLIENAKVGKKITKELKDNIKDQFEEFLNTQAQEMLNLLQSPAFEVIKKNKKDEYVNRLLPNDFVDTGVVNELMLHNFLVNDYINSIAFNNMLDGDSFMGTKNWIDFINRNAGKNAYGASLGEGQSKIAIIKAFNDERIPGIDWADAQSYSTEGWMMNTYLRKLGKLPRNVERVWQQKRMGKELSSSDLSILRHHKAMSQSKKLVAKDGYLYWKTSVAEIERGGVSYIDPQDEAAKDKLYQQLFKAETDLIYAETDKAKQKALNKIDTLYIGIHKLWKPYPHKEVLHNLLNQMERKGIDLIAFDSAMKTNKPNVSNVQTDGSVDLIANDINNEFIREQVITSGFKNKIVHGTQLIQLIWSEHDPETEVQIGDKVYKLGYLRDLYQNKIADRTQRGRTRLEKILFTNRDGQQTLKPQYKELYESFVRSIEKSNPDPYLVEMFATDLQSSPVYNPNFSGVSQKFYQMFLAFASADVLKHKVNGVKYTLQSDYGHKVLVDTEGNVVMTKDFDASKKYGEPRHLAYDESTGEAEAIISGNVASLYKLQKGQTIPKDLAKQLGFRIPTQDKHSMIKLKVVDILPPSTMNTIIVHPKVIELSGADFDIDSLFVRTYSVTGKARYGNYLQVGSIDRAIQELRASRDNSKDFSEFLKRAKSEIAFDAEAQFEAMKASGESNLEALQSGFTNTDRKNKLKELIDNYYKTKGLSSDIAEFKKSNSALHDQILANIAAYKEGRLGDIVPLTTEELDNSILDLEYEMVNTGSTGNKTIAETPMTMDVIENVLDTWKGMGLDYSVSVKAPHTFLSKIQSILANDAGNAGIGPVALSNVAVQNLLAKGAKLLHDVSILGEKAFDDFGEGLNRVNNIISTILSAMTDNNKHLFSSQLNLNMDTVGIAATIAGLGVKPDKLFATFRQPAITVFANLLDRKRAAIKLGTERSEINGLLSDLDSMIEYTFDKLGLSDVNMDVVSDLNVPLTVENLHEGMKYEKGLNSSLSREQYARLQMNALGEIYNAKKVADEIRNYTRLLSLIKGLEGSPTQLDRLEDSLIELGIKIKESDGKVTFTKIKGADTYLDWEDILLSEDSNPYVIENIKTAMLLKKHLGKFLIPFSDKGYSLLNTVKKNANPRRFYDEGRFSKLLRSVSAYLLIKKDKQRREPGFYSPDIVFKPDLIIQHRELMKEVEDRTSPLYNNKFLLALRENIYESKFHNKWVFGLTVNTRKITDPDLRTKILNDSGILFENKKYRKFAKDLVKSLVVSDALMYKNGSYLTNLDPTFLSQLIGQLDGVQDAFNSGSIEKISQEMGMDWNEMRKELTELFLYDSSNFTERRIAKSRIVTILNKVTRGIMAEHKGVSPEAIASLKSEEAREYRPVWHDRKEKTLHISLRKGFNTKAKDYAPEFAYMREMADKLASSSSLFVKGSYVWKEATEKEEAKTTTSLGFPLMFNFIIRSTDDSGQTVERNALYKLTKINRNPFKDEWTEPFFENDSNYVNALDAVYEEVPEINSSAFSMLGMSVEEVQEYSKREATEEKLAPKKEEISVGRKLTAEEQNALDNAHIMDAASEARAKENSHLKHITNEFGVMIKNPHYAPEGKKPIQDKNKDNC